MSRRGTQRTLTPTAKCVEVLFEIGLAVIRGNKYKCNPEFYCQGLDGEELNRLVDRGELSLRKFEIVIKGYEYLCNYRRQLDSQTFRKFSCVQCSRKCVA